MGSHSRGWENSGIRSAPGLGIPSLYVTYFPGENPKGISSGIVSSNTSFSLRSSRRCSPTRVHTFGSRVAETLHRAEFHPAGQHVSSLWFLHGLPRTHKHPSGRWRGSGRSTDPAVRRGAWLLAPTASRHPTWGKSLN